MDESSNDDARSDQRAFETAFQRLVADNDLAVFTDNEVSQAIRFRDAPHHQSSSTSIRATSASTSETARR
jgi:hypothetical protein